MQRSVPMNEQTKSEEGRSLSVKRARLLTGGTWALGWLLMISPCVTYEWLTTAMNTKFLWMGIVLVHLAHPLGHVYAKEAFNAFWLFVASLLVYPALYLALLVGLSGNLQGGINPFLVIAVLIHFTLIGFTIFDAGRAARRRNRLSAHWR